MPTATIIIPLHRRTSAFDRCVKHAIEVAGGLHEVMVVCDRDPGPLPPGVTPLITGSSVDTSPAEKRDVALAKVETEVCVFLDDDAHPREDWLERGLAHFGAQSTIAAVGGPGITPPDSPWRERASGAFYESPFGSGRLRFRFRSIGGIRDVDDLPAFNLFIRTDALRAIGGWQSKFYGGEDTMTCLRLLQAGHRLIYDPDVVVYHHRRPIFASHIRQVGNVGRHRGYFARVLPETSRRPLYFAPTLGLVASCAVALAGSKSRRVRITGSVTGIAACVLIGRRALKDGCEPTIAAALPAVVAASHAAYGLQFARGFFTPSIEEM